MSTPHQNMELEQSQDVNKWRNERKMEVEELKSRQLAMFNKYIIKNKLDL